MRTYVNRSMWCAIFTVSVAVVGIAVSRSSAGQPAPTQSSGQSEAVESAVNSLSGRVVDFEGNPVQDATVYAVISRHGYIHYRGPQDVYVWVNPRYWYPLPLMNARLAGRTTTDEDGRFEIANMERGMYSLLAVNPERGAGTIRGTKNPSDGPGVTLQMVPPTFVEGRIVGLPPNANIDAVLHAPDELLMSTPYWLWANQLHIEFAEDGSFHVGPLLKGGDCKLDVVDQNLDMYLLLYPFRCEVGTTTEIDLDLTGEHKVTGQVLGPTGDPLEGVEVAIGSLLPWTNETGSARLYVTLTDRDGRYTLGGVVEDTYRLSAFCRKPGLRHGPDAVEFSFARELRVPVTDPERANIKIQRYEMHVGDVAPAIQVATGDGQEFKLSDQMGKVVLLDFLWRWPTGAVYQRTNLRKVWDEYADDGRFNVLTIIMKPKDAASSLSEECQTYLGPWSISDLPSLTL